MPDYTIITTTAEIDIHDADRYGLDDAGDCHVYGDDDRSLGTIPSERFVAIFDSEHGTTGVPG